VPPSEYATPILDWSRWPSMHSRGRGCVSLSAQPGPRTRHSGKLPRPLKQARSKGVLAVEMGSRRALFVRTGGEQASSLSRPCHEYNGTDRTGF
jgi:hypothetical protein